jgi:hypothetical protein
MRVAKLFGESTGRSRDILRKAKGITLIEIGLRSDGSRGDQAGEAGP